MLCVGEKVPIKCQDCSTVVCYSPCNVMLLSLCNIQYSTFFCSYLFHFEVLRLYWFWLG